MALRNKKHERVLALGTSMEPTIPGQSWVWVKNITQPPVIGQIALYLNVKEELVCHRIIAVMDNHFLLKGDAHKQTGEWVHSEQVIGIAYAFQAGLKRYNLTNGNSAFHLGRRLIHFYTRKITKVLNNENTTS